MYLINKVQVYQVFKTEINKVVVYYVVYEINKIIVQYSVKKSHKNIIVYLKKS